jgi:hypothetical protein
LIPDALVLAQARGGRLCRALTLGLVTLGLVTLGLVTLGLVTSGLGLSIFAPFAFAADQRIEFDIPAQPLELALSAYGTTANVQLVFDVELTQGLRSAALKGAFSPEIALEKLLAGSGLAARAIGDQGFTLVALPAARGIAPGAVSPTVLRLNSYSAAIQDAVRNALCRHRETTPGSYRALVRFWTNASGAVDRTELVTSTGDDRRDAMLSTAFRDLSIAAAPPADLPQPVTLLVSSDGWSSRYCLKDGAGSTRADGGHGAAR